MIVSKPFIFGYLGIMAALDSIEAFTSLHKDLHTNWLLFAAPIVSQYALYSFVIQVKYFQRYDFFHKRILVRNNDFVVAFEVYSE